MQYQLRRSQTQDGHSIDFYHGITARQAIFAAPYISFATAASPYFPRLIAEMMRPALIFDARRAHYHSDSLLACKFSRR